MKNKFVIPLFVVMLFSFWGCNDDSSSATKTITMEVNLTDTHGNSLEVYPIGDENLNADTLLRSKKILQKVGDSIVLGKEAIDLIFHSSGLNTGSSSPSDPGVLPSLILDLHPTDG